MWYVIFFRFNFIKSFENFFLSGGNTADACQIYVDMEEKSATSYSKRTIWTLDDSLKSIGSSNMMSTNWDHATIYLPPSDFETLVRTKLRIKLSEIFISDISPC